MSLAGVLAHFMASDLNPFRQKAPVVFGFLQVGAASPDRPMTQVSGFKDPQLSR
jgi:hypothetical protein